MHIAHFKDAVKTIHINVKLYGDNYTNSSESRGKRMTLELDRTPIESFILIVHLEWSFFLEPTEQKENYGDLKTNGDKN